VQGQQSRAARMLCDLSCTHEVQLKVLTTNHIITRRAHDSGPQEVTKVNGVSPIDAPIVSSRHQI